MTTDFTDAYVVVGTERETRWETDALLSSLDRAGLQRAIVFPEDRELAVENRSGNRRIIAVCRQAPERLIPGCSVNPWWGSRAAEWAAEAVDAGARVLFVDPPTQGFHLLDPLATWLWEWCEQRSLPIHVRVSPTAASTPIQGAQLARQHPGTRWLLGGSGVTDYSYETGSVLDTLPPNVWLDTSYARPSGLAMLVERVPAGRLVFASAAPRQNLFHEFTRVATATPVAAHPALFAANAAAFLGR